MNKTPSKNSGFDGHFFKKVTADVSIVSSQKEHPCGRSIFSHKNGVKTQAFFLTPFCVFIAL